MFICCNREMRCEQNGVGADFGNGHVYRGDLWRCDCCGRGVLHTNQNAMFDPHYKCCEKYIKVGSEVLEPR